MGPAQTWVGSRSGSFGFGFDFMKPALRHLEAGAGFVTLRKAWLWLQLLAVRKPWLRLWLRGFGSVWYIFPSMNSCWNDMYCFLCVTKYTKN